MDTIALSGQTSLATRLLDEYGDRADRFDDHGSIEDQELAARAARQQFYTVRSPEPASWLLGTFEPVPAGVTLVGRRGRFDRHANLHDRTLGVRHSK